MQEPQEYKDEYRMHPSSSEGVPAYLRDLITKMHDSRVEGSSWACEAVIVQEPHSYTIGIGASELVISNSLNGETDTATYPVDRFDDMGGIADLISTVVNSGGLPEAVSDDEFEVTELSI